MEQLHKIDFCAVICVRNANPNGDPLLENRPRTTNEGYGVISAVCLKRKLRNRLQDMGHSIFVQSENRREDDYSCLQERAEGTLPPELTKDTKTYHDAACKFWFDVRAFGQVFAYSGKKRGRKATEDGSVETSSVSVGVRGPVTIQDAVTVHPIDITEMKITKSVNGTPAEKGKSRSSDTMGDRYSVPFGLYVTYGSINPFLAQKTGFSADDAEAIHEALKTLFENDESASRPSGSMEVLKVFWWTHDAQNGSQPSGVVHRSVKITANTDYPSSIDDFKIAFEDVPKVALDIFSAI